MAARAEKKAAKAKEKEDAKKLARNDWIEIDGMWAAVCLEGRGHCDGPHYGRNYRIAVPTAAFGVHLYPGGQARFTEVAGGYGEIFNLPAQVGARRARATHVLAPRPRHSRSFFFRSRARLHACECDVYVRFADSLRSFGVRDQDLSGGHRRLVHLC